MKARYILPLIPLSLFVAEAQMPNTAPQSFDASGQSTRAQAGVQNDDPNRIGETAPPTLFGMELPLLDPSTDTVSYNGGKFDVGNNKVVRERFEKYLNQTPDDTEESTKYRNGIEELLRETRKYTKNSPPIGSKVLVRMGRTLYKLTEYPGDGDQCGALASCIVSVLDVQRGNLKRDKNNEELEKEIEKLVKKTNSLTNQNTQKGSGGGNIGNIQGKSGGNSGISHTVKIAFNTQQIADHKAKKGANAAANQAALAQAKIQYQAMLVNFLLQRRFDHAVIGSRIYRHVFKDGSKNLDMNKDSDAYKMLTGVTGYAPTIDVLDSTASNARREVDQSMDAITNLMAQNKLGEATNRLITAVSIGEYMQSVAVFPVESRRRISEYWTLRKQALEALNARDYDRVEKISDKLCELDVDYNDSQLKSYTKGKKRQSNAYLRAAKIAKEKKDEAEFQQQVQNATIIWPLNPELDRGEEELKKLDGYEKEKEEFNRYIANSEFRNIFSNRTRLEKVCMLDDELKTQYQDVLTYVQTIDSKLEEFLLMADQQGSQGAGLVYEKLLEMQEKNESPNENPLFRGKMKKDPEFKDALNLMEKKARKFVETLNEAERLTNAHEYGAALAAYYRALELNQGSVRAKAAIKEIEAIIFDTKFDLDD